MSGRPILNGPVVCHISSKAGHCKASTSVTNNEISSAPGWLDKIKPKLGCRYTVESCAQSL